MSLLFNTIVVLLTPLSGGNSRAKSEAIAKQFGISGLLFVSPLIQRTYEQSEILFDCKGTLNFVGIKLFENTPSKIFMGTI